eukprot:scaffold25502_cov129-Isochrysis_galbana.AAC.3
MDPNSSCQQRGQTPLQTLPDNIRPVQGRARGLGHREVRGPREADVLGEQGVPQRELPTPLESRTGSRHLGCRFAQVDAGAPRCCGHGCRVHYVPVLSKHAPQDPCARLRLADTGLDS